MKTKHWPFILIGAGGHAKAVLEAAEWSGGRIVACVDPRSSPDWLMDRNIVHHKSDEVAFKMRARAVMGLGGVMPAHLFKRLTLFFRYLSTGHDLPKIAHQTAVISPSAEVEEGAIVLARAVVQPGALVQRGAIINTGSIVEHDCTVGEGAHIAPGAVLLGGCKIGRCAMIGAGAVILPGKIVEPETLVKALAVY